MITKEQAKELLEILIQGGNDYAEIFQETKEGLGVSNFDNKRIDPYRNRTEGTGLRTWKGAEVSYLSIDSIDFKELKEAAIKFNPKGNGREINFTNIDGEFKENDFGDWTFKTLIGKTKELVKLMKEQNSKIEVGTSFISTRTENRIIANSDGAFIKKTAIFSTIVAQPQSKEGNFSETAQHKIAKQITLKELMKLVDKKEFTDELIYATDLAVRLLSADRIDSGEMDVILPSGFGAVLFHEAVGHPLEANQVANNKSKFSGLLGKKVATDIVTLIDDGTIDGEIGSASYDDEGTLNQKRVLIKDGILQEYLVDKYNGEVFMNRKSNGAGRRQSYRFNNTSRMSNTYLQNGTSTVEEIISSTKNGFYAKRLGGGQVNPFTGQFNFGVDEGYIVKDGKIGKLVKGATLIGNGIEALMKIDMIANDFKIDAGSCGSSSGYIPVTCGQPTLRVKNMTVGGK